MHALSLTRTGNQAPANDVDFQKLFASLGGLCQGGGNGQPAQIRDQLARIGKQEGPKLLEAQRMGNKVAFDTILSQIISEMLSAAGILDSFTRHIDKSHMGFVQLLRATRASLMCMALLHEHALLLIEKASKGDRRAVLDLIKIDKMFVNDQCCKDTIRKATVQEDYGFLAQVQRALQYRPKMGRRELFHVYVFHLFLFEKFGVTVSPINELWRRLDPLGREYESLEAFEKDIQRRRVDFNEILKAGTVAAQSFIDASQNRGDESENHN